MPIIITTPQPLTTLQYQQAFAERTRDGITELVFEMAQEFTAVFNDLWTNVNLTPQQCFDAVGTDAKTLLQILSTLQSNVNALIPGKLTQTPPFQFVVNPDGTVTVGAPV